MNQEPVSIALTDPTQAIPSSVRVFRSGIWERQIALMSWVRSLDIDRAFDIRRKFDLPADDFDHVRKNLASITVDH